MLHTLRLMEQKSLVHICNDIGKWGKGFVLAVSKRWPSPESIYKQAFTGVSKPQLGDVQFIQVEDDIVVANIIGQAGVRSPKTPNHLHQFATLLSGKV